MNTRLSHEQIEMVSIAQINVLNPRARNRRIHQEIIENILKAGLKRPIVVSRRRNSKDQFHFDLVCGQGRIEAFENLGWARNPCDRGGRGRKAVPDAERGRECRASASPAD